MSDFFELCTRRQSCRKFSDKPVEREKLVRCVEAARLAPSACNSQPWRFVVVDDPEAVAKIARAGQPFGNVNSFLDNAKAFIVLIEEHAVLMPGIRPLLDSQHFAAGDLGIVSAYLCLEATAQGLGNCQIGIFNREAICQALGLDFPQTRINTLIAIGYPESDTIRPKARKPLEEIAQFV